MKKIKVEGLDEEIYVDITDNGMPIFMWVNEKVNNFYLTLNVKYGSIHTEFKPKGQKGFIKVPNGIAHFLEHMMFYMPNNTTAHAYFNELGAQINACTTPDFTFYEVFSSTNFKENLEYLLEYVFTPYFTKEYIKAERDIINEEIKMYEDNLNARLIFKMHECLWHRNKRKYLVSGSAESIKKITVDNLKEVYNNFYHPQNMFIVLTGNFNPSEAVAIIKDKENSFDFPKYFKPQIKEIKEPNKVVTKYYEEKNNVDIAKLKLSLKIPLVGLKDILKDELKLYLNILLKSNFGITSFIHTELYSNNLITQALAYSVSIYESHLTLTITAEANYPEEVLKIILKTLEDIDITSEDFNRCKKVIISSLVQSFDDIEEINSLIQDNIVMENKIINDYYKIIKNLNMETLKKIIKKLSFQNKSIVIFKPNKR